MKQILIKLGDGRLAYSRPEAAIRSEETEESYLTRIGKETIDKCIRDGQPGWVGSQIVAFVDESVVNSANREFRAGWDWTTPEPKIDYNIPKCREIQEERIETARKSKRIELLVREELGENVMADKAAVRAINARALCQAAQTLEELKAVMPDILR